VTRKRKKVKSRILTDSPIKDRMEQEALARAAVKKKYGKGAKNYRNKIQQKSVGQFYNPGLQDGGEHKKHQRHHYIRYVETW